MLSAGLPGPGASHFCGCGSCCSCTMEKNIKSWASQCSPLELSAWRGTLCCSKGQNEAEKGWCCPGSLFCITFSLTTPGQYWLQAGWPMLIIPLPAASFSPSATNTQLSIPSGVPKHTSMFPHSHWSGAHKTVLSYVMESLNLVHGQGCVKDYGKSIRVLECVINFQVIANKVISVLKCFPGLEDCKAELFYFPGISSIMSTHL